MCSFQRYFEKPEVILSLYFFVLYCSSLEAFRIFSLSSVFCGHSDHILLPRVLVGIYFDPLCWDLMGPFDVETDPSIM